MYIGKKRPSQWIISPPQGGAKRKQANPPMGHEFSHMNQRLARLTKSRTTRQLVFADTFVRPTNTNYRSEHKNGKTHEIANDLRAPTRLYVRRPQIIKYGHANCKARTPTGSNVRRHNHMQTQKWQNSKDCERPVRADTFVRSEPTNYHIRKT